MSDLRTIEKDSIHAFVQRAADEGYLSGRVLDYGCGKQPYRDIVEAAGADYIPFDRAAYPANVSGEDLGPTHWPPSGEWNTILCTQVFQYVPIDNGELNRVIGAMQWLLNKGDGERRYFGEHPGHLVLTYPTNWPEVEPEDLHRFTKAGMERLLKEAGFEIVLHERRAEVVPYIGTLQAEFKSPFALGYGVIARA